MNKANQKGQQDIDWWRLHTLCPPVVIGLEIGLIVGPLLGAAAGLAVTVKAGHAAGLIWGIAFGIVTGALAGITCARPQLEPRAVHFAIDWTRCTSDLPRCHPVRAGSRGDLRRTRPPVTAGCCPR